MNEHLKNVSKEDWLELINTKNFSPSNVEFASEEIKADKDVVMAAVKKDGCALRFASSELRNDREIAITAIQNTGFAFPNISSELRNDREIAMMGVQSYSQALDYLNSELRNDREIVMAAVQKHGDALRFASQELQNDEEIQMAAAQRKKQNDNQLNEMVDEYFNSRQPKPMMTEKEYREELETQMQKEHDYLSGNSLRSNLNELYESAVAKQDEPTVVEYKEIEEPKKENELAQQDLSNLSLEELETYKKTGQIPQSTQPIQQQTSINKL